MRSDDALRVDAMNLLIEELGEVEAKRFIFLIKREDFDYTGWQQSLWNDLTIDEVYTLTADCEKVSGNCHDTNPEKNNQTTEREEVKKFKNKKMEIMFDE